MSSTTKNGNGTVSNELPVSQEEFNGFLAQMQVSFNPEIGKMLVMGAEAFRKAHDKHAEDLANAHDDHHAEMLSQAQHPTFAFAGGARNSARQFMAVSDVGDILILRTPSNLLANAQGKLYPEAADFLTLVKAKGIHQVVCGIDSDNDMVDLISRYPQTISDISIDADIRSFISEFKEIYDDVVLASDDNFSHYKNRGINLVGTHDEKLKQALAFELAQNNYDAAQKDPTLARTVMVVNNSKTNERFVLNPKTQSFVKIPNLDEKNSDVALKKFLSSLPKTEEWTAKKDGSHIGHHIARAYTESLRPSTKEQPKIKVAVSSCSDSRTHVTTVIGMASHAGAFVYRIAGASLSKLNGGMTKLAKVYHALAKRNGVEHHIHAHHGDCGAMNVIRTYAENKDAFKSMPAFSKLGERNEFLYHIVKQNGLDHYKKAGLEFVGSDSDQFLQAMAVERALADFNAIKDKGIPTTLVFQNTVAVEAFALNNRTSKWIKIPQKPSTMAHRPKVSCGAKSECHEPKNH